MADLKDFERWGALPVYARHAMVATADQHASEAALAVLRDGGNVIDAAVTAAFVLSVTQPGMCGIGGGGHLLARYANGESLCLDFREQAARAASRYMFDSMPRETSMAGWLAAAVPGTVKGLAEAHRKGGRLSWARLVEPAMELAAEGHPVSYLRAKMMAGSSVLPRDPESYRILLNNGEVFEPGDVLRQPELAETLQRIASQGGDEFYLGQTAEEFTRASAAAGGLITKADLEAYTCEERKPLTRAYKAHEVWTMPPSSAGGIGLLQILAMLEEVDFGDDGPLSSAVLHYLAEAMRRAFADRAAMIGDPAFVPFPDRLLAAEHVSQLRASIDAHHATPSTSFTPGTVPAESPCTTHISIMDGEGNAAALTFTLNGRYGNGVTVPGLGFLLNNNMNNFAVQPGKPNLYGVTHGEANSIAPGKRPASSMAPTIVCREGQAELVIGTPGGPTIVSSMAQALLYMLDFGWNPQDAVNAPRIHHQWMPDVLYLERGFASDVTRALEARGHRLEYRVSLTDMNAIVRRDGWLEGAADCRRDGYVAGM